MSRVCVNERELVYKISNKFSLQKIRKRDEVHSFVCVHTERETYLLVVCVCVHIGDYTERKTQVIVV